MNFLALLDRGIFKEPFYRAVIPTFPLAVAWIVDFGFLRPGILEHIQNPVVFLPLALLWHTVQIVVPFFFVRWLLIILVDWAEDAEQGIRWLFIIFHAAAFTLINFALLGATFGAAHLLGASEKITSVHPVLAMLAGINFLWYVAAFLTGRELLHLLLPDRYPVPAASPLPSPAEQS